MAIALRRAMVNGMRGGVGAAHITHFDNREPLLTDFSEVFFKACWLVQTFRPTKALPFATMVHGFAVEDYKLVLERWIIDRPRGVTGK
jgi:hypothetical protein